MNAHETHNAIREWVQERLDDVEQEGTLSIIGLVHAGGAGNEVELTSIKAGAPAWGDAQKMADLLYLNASRHAKGLSGAQQFSLQAVYGTSGRPTRFLPFGLVMNLAFGNLPGGGYATESATPLGMQQQGMRLTELIVQGTIGQISHTFRTQAELINALREMNKEMAIENRELFIALRQELTRGVELTHAKKMEQLKFVRSTDERKRLLKVMPALVNAMSGREVFPLSASDTSLIESFLENVSQDEIRPLITLLQEKNPELGALFMNRFHDAQMKKSEETADLQRIAQEAVGGGYDRGAEDAAGEPLPPPIKEVSTSAVGAPKALLHNGNGNGEPNGNGSGHTPAADSALLDEIFAQTPPGQVGMLANALASSNPGLAQRIKDRYERSRR